MSSGTKTFRVYISGKQSSRMSQTILHKMLPSIGFSAAANGISSEQIPSIRNMHREDESAYFDVDIPDIDGDSDDHRAIEIIESMKKYILENLVQYEDITTEPPKKL